MLKEKRSKRAEDKKKRDADGDGER